MKNEAAVPTLVKAVESMDNKPGIVSIKKEAIKALGEIGSPEALPALVKILNKKAFWRRALVDEVRAAAAQALASIRSDEVADILREAMDDKADIVASAAAKAYKQLKRNEQQ
jgi:HEAT repeat protein